MNKQKGNWFQEALEKVENGETWNDECIEEETDGRSDTSTSEDSDN